MTSQFATSPSSDQITLRHLVGQLSGLLENSAESAEQRIQRAEALLRDYFPPKHAEVFKPRIAKGSGPALLAWQVRRLTEYIESNIDLPIPIQELAGIARISPSHFCRAFRKTLNESPHCFVMRRRIVRSQTMMATTVTPLSDIAIECGFADQAHFSRVHRKMVGIPPGTWRRMSRNDGSAAVPVKKLSSTPPRRNYA